MRIKKISVIGDGGWGTTLAILLAQKKIQVTLWSSSKDYAGILRQKRLNPLYLQGVKIPKSIEITSEFQELSEADLFVSAVPSQYLRGVLERSKNYYDPKIPVLSVTKGIEDGSFLRMSQLIWSVWRPKRLAVLSGPTIAMEVARQIPSTAVVASKDKKLAQAVQNLFSTNFFRIYTNPDVTGVEWGGSFKNIIALACGVADGLRFGSNTKAAILSRGLAEMARLGVRMGARRETFFGVSGLGDLVTTCFSPLSRNRLVGEKIGCGKSLKEATAGMKMVAEGVATSKAVYHLAKKFKIEVPITSEIYRVLFKGSSPQQAVRRLMARKKKAENK